MKTRVSFLLAAACAAFDCPRAGAETAPGGFDGPGTWAFPARADDFSKADALGLRGLLNERSAGEGGFVRRSADGASFVDGAGRPLRFWAVVSDGYRLPPEQMELHAAWLAKRGVNMVRIHANVSVNEEGARVTDVNAKELDGILRWVAVCKRHGIYVTLSPYWAHAKAPASWGIDGYAGDQPWGVLFFNERLQEGYRAWVTAVYTTPNPYAGGVALKDEPAVALAQVKNEDSLLFWTFDAIKPAQKRLLGRKFLAWALARHGGEDGLNAAWQGATAPGDDRAAGVLGFRPTYELTGKAPRPAVGEAVRLADQTRFLTETQRGFYAWAADLFRELGVRSLTNAMNWRSADQVTLDDAERYTYAAMDVIAVNFYTGGAHQGENNGYRIDPGHTFTNGSVLRGTAPFPGALKQVAGYPMVVTETAWVHPNLYQSEGPFLAAAYTPMTGVDALYWFAYPGQSGPEWMTDTRAMFWPVGDSHAAWKWYGNHPMQGGQFPAYALAFRRGYVDPAPEPAVREERSLDDLWERRIPVISEAGRFDPNRDAGVFAPRSPLKQEIDRAAFFVGPVLARYGGDPARTHTADLARHIDPLGGDVRSLTGQQRINQKRGVATVDAPAFQGVCGFLREAGGDWTLGATRWESEDDYAALAAVSVDGLDLKASRRVLVQAGTVARMTGFRTEGATVTEEGRAEPGERVVSNGLPPWRVARTRATLTLLNPGLTRATVLDENLKAAGEVAVSPTKGGIQVRLPEDALYLLLEAP